MSQNFGSAGGILITDTKDRANIHISRLKTVPFEPAVIDVIEAPSIDNVSDYQGKSLIFPFEIVGSITRLKLASGAVHADYAEGSRSDKHSYQNQLGRLMAGLSPIPSARSVQTLLAAPGAVLAENRGGYEYWAISEPQLIPEFVPLLAGTPFADGFGVLVSPLLVFVCAAKADEILGVLVLSVENIKGRAPLTLAETGQYNLLPAPDNSGPTVRALWLSSFGANRGLAFGMIGVAAEKSRVPVQGLAWSFGVKHEGCPAAFSSETFDAIRQRGVKEVLIA